MNSCRILFPLALLLLLACGCERDYDRPPGPGIVTGQVQFGATSGQPVSDARVRLIEGGLTARTDSDGRFRLDHVPSGDYTLRVDATVADTDYVIQPEDAVLVRGPAVTDLGVLNLTRAGRVTGTVTISGGMTPLNAVVYVIQGNQLTHAADNGGFTLEGVPAGSWNVGAARPGYMLSEPVQVLVAEGGVESADLLLEPIPEGATGSASGMVLLGNPGAKSGVSVALIERFSSNQYTTRTDDAGQFWLDNVPVGFYQLIASYQGYRPVGLPNLEIRRGVELSLATLILPPDTGEPVDPEDLDPSGNLDDDADGVPDDEDNCPVVPNPDQTDADNNGIGDACEEGVNLEEDFDGDGWLDVEDNCPLVSNPGQENNDGDGNGDLCDGDDDNDSVPDFYDNCQYIENPSQSDTDTDGIGDACDDDFEDDDGDGIPDSRDNCPGIDNPGQENHDDDPMGDACDPDMDNDGLLDKPNQNDSCPLIPDPGNDPDLCNWELIYSAQDSDGDIDLYYYKMDPLQGTAIQLTDLGGQSWGASFSPDDLSTVYFHHQPAGGGYPRICRLPLDLTAAPHLSAECFDWGSDAMNPAFCGSFMLYDRFAGDSWTIFVADITTLPDPGQPLAFVEPPFPPNTRPVSYRFPSCVFSPQGYWEVGYSVDFLDQQIYPGVATLDWGFWVGTFFPPDLMEVSIGLMADEGTNERRSCPGPNSGEWFVEREEGGRGDILLANSDMSQGVVADGSVNLEPAFRAARDLGGNGLLAYQSDKYGTFDVFVRSNSGGLIRVTEGVGWEGSPTWVP